MTRSSSTLSLAASRCSRVARTRARSTEASEHERHGDAGRGAAGRRHDSGGRIDCGTDCSRQLRGHLRGRRHPRAPASGAGRRRARHDPPSGFRVPGATTARRASATRTTAPVIRAPRSTRLSTTPASRISSLTGADGAIAVRHDRPSRPSASDPQTGIANVQFLVDGVAAGPADTSAPYGTSYDATSHPDDTDVTVTARATNADGESEHLGGAHQDRRHRAPAHHERARRADLRPGTTQTWTTAPRRDHGPAGGAVQRRTAGDAPSFGACSGSGSHSVTNKPDGEYVAASRRPTGPATSRSSRGRSRSTPCAPQTSITGGPADGSSSTATSARFTFSSGEAGSTLRVPRLPGGADPGRIRAVPGRHRRGLGLLARTYAFEVRATDPSGNVDASPATRTFTVTAPRTGGNRAETRAAGGTAAGSPSMAGPTVEAHSAAAASTPRSARSGSASESARASGRSP